MIRRVVIMALSALLLVGQIVSAAPPAILLYPVNLDDVPYISQTALRLDKEAKSIKLGTSDWNLWDNGCAVASLAMVYRYFGVDTDLVRMNRSLTDAGVINRSGYMLWNEGEKIAAAGDPWIAGVVLSSPRNQSYLRRLLSISLSKGWPVIIRLAWTSADASGNPVANTHYVVVVGRDAQNNFLINDPWGASGKTGEVVRKAIRLEDGIAGVGLDAVDQVISVFPYAGAPAGEYPLSPQMAREYSAHGGAIGSLGRAVQSEQPLPLPLSTWQRFENGAIFNLAGRTFALCGPTWQSYWNGGAWENWGYPRSDTYTRFSGGDCERLETEKAVFVWDVADPPDTVAICSRYNSYKVSYYANDSLSGEPAFVTYERSLNFSWDDRPPMPWFEEGSAFSLRAELSFSPSVYPGWWYSFSGTAQGEMRVQVNRNDSGWVSSFAPVYPYFIGRGIHKIIVDYRKTTSPASLMFAFSSWPSKPAYAAERVSVEGYAVPASCSRFSGAESAPEVNGSPWLFAAIDMERFGDDCWFVPQGMVQYKVYLSVTNNTGVWALFAQATLNPRNIRLVTADGGSYPVLGNWPSAGTPISWGLYENNNLSTGPAVVPPGFTVTSWSDNYENVIKNTLTFELPEGLTAVAIDLDGTWVELSGVATLPENIRNEIPETSGVIQVPPHGEIHINNVNVEGSSNTWNFETLLRMDVTYENLSATEDQTFPMTYWVFGEGGGLFGERVRERLDAEWGGGLPGDSFTVGPNSSMTLRHTFVVDSKSPRLKLLVNGFALCVRPLTGAPEPPAAISYPGTYVPPTITLSAPATAKAYTVVTVTGVVRSEAGLLGWFCVNNDKYLSEPGREAAFTLDYLVAPGPNPIEVITVDAAGRPVVGRVVIYGVD